MKILMKQLITKIINKGMNWCMCDNYGQEILFFTFTRSNIKKALKISFLKNKLAYVAKLQNDTFILK